MGFYKGISKKTMADGSICIMARIKHDGTNYPIKNMTNLYGIRTEKKAFEKMGEIKALLSKGIDPFISSDGTLNDLFYKKVETNRKNGTWKESTIKSRLYFYDKHIKYNLGKKKIEKIKYEEVMKIIDKFHVNQSDMKNQIIDTLRPIFKEGMKNGIILKNIMDEIPKYNRSKKRIDIKKRTHHSHTDIVRRLYKAIGEYDQAHKENIEQHKMFLYMILLTAHRYNEVNLLEKEHCDLDRRLIIAPASITKTDRDYHYPIPDEVFDYIKNHKGGRLWNIPRGGQSGRIFHRILVKAKIETINDYSLSMHDTRRLMASIVVNILKLDSRLAEYMLEHSEQKTIKHYLEFDDDDKIRAYKKYWSYIREEDYEEDEIVSVNKENNIQESSFEKLEKLIEMLEKGYITKEQFETERDRLY
jgi:hypothetical protein